MSITEVRITEVRITDSLLMCGHNISSSVSMNTLLWCVVSVLFLVLFISPTTSLTMVFESCIHMSSPKYKLVKGGSTVFKVQKDGCGVPSTARALLGPEGF